MKIRLNAIVALLGLAVFCLAGPAQAQAVAATPPATAAAQRIHDLLDQAPAVATPEDASLRRFYTARGDAPAWDDPQRVAALAAALATAPEHGLEASFPKAALPPSGDPAARDVALTRLALSFATALASGQVAPERFESDWAISAPDFAAAAGLATALSHDLGAWYEGLAPHHPAYRRLMAALVRYRAIAGDGGWANVPRGDALKLGMTDERVRALRRRLEAEGDLARKPAPAVAPAVVSGDAGPIKRVAVITDGAETPPPADTAALPDLDTVFDPALETAVRRFQRRYGIGVDGAAGPRTIAAMDVPVRARIEQIELNLERWRALPHDLGASYMMVNVPSETLDIVDNGTTVMSMKTVVGDTGHPTPVVRATMVALTLNPYWRIPASIIKAEIMPKAKRDRTYLAKNDIVFAPGQGWQQLPGPKNPLGQLKFELPNKFDVYLHDTPSRAAFDRYFRAQSHGCVRLEHAAELASLVLRDTAWNDQTLSQAVATGENRRIDLKRHWRVYMLYATSFGDEDGTVEFRDDLYGRDARLKDALAAQRAARTGL